MILELKDGELDTKVLTSTVGGCAVNTSRSANFFLQSVGKRRRSVDFNERVMTIGAIGSDAQGLKVQSQLNRESVSFSVYKAENTMTGSCAVTVNNGDRTCIAILDACEKYPMSHMETVLNSESIKGTKIFYTTGFFLESSP